MKNKIKEDTLYCSPHAIEFACKEYTCKKKEKKNSIDNLNFHTMAGSYI
jgi:hypothetical protein